MFTAAIISIADRRVTMTFFADSSFEPSASVVVTTISMAMGIDTTSSTTVNSIAALKLVWWYAIRKMKQMMQRPMARPVRPYMTFTST
jgi:superfamily II helicase